MPPLKSFSALKAFSAFKTRSLLIAAMAVWGAGVSCKKPSPSNLKNDQWADHPVELVKLNQNFQIMLQTFDELSQLNSKTEFHIFAVRENEGTEGKRYKVYYVDQDPNNANKPSSISYDLETSYNFQQAPGRIDVYLSIKRASPSYQNLLQQDPQNQSRIMGPYSSYQRIYLGQAVYTDWSQRITRIAMNPRLEASKVAIYGDKKFEGNGHIALHYMPNPTFSEAKSNLECEEKPVCDAVTLEEICGGDIMEAGCRPDKVAKADFESFVKAGKLDKLTAVGDGTYLLGNNVSSGRISFQSAEIAASKDNNQKFCDDAVAYLVRDGSGLRNNPACRITREPSEDPQNGKLFCTISVKFEEPRDVHEYGCNLTAVFKGSKKEFQSLQILSGTMQ